MSEWLTQDQVNVLGGEEAIEVLWPGRIDLVPYFVFRSHGRVCVREYKKGIHPQNIPLDPVGNTHQHIRVKLAFADEDDDS